MAYNKGLKYNDQTFNFAIALTGTEAPTTSTEGVIGQPFFVITNNKIASMYVCTNVADTTYTWGKVSLGENGIKYVTQTLTDAQKKQARTNIGAGTSSFSGSYNDLTNKPNIPAATVIDTTLSKSGQAADAKAAGDAIGKKIDKAQGTGNAGKILGIGADGNVTPQDKPVQALAGASAPTTTMAGVVGQEYYVIANGEVTEMYVCTAVANGTYTWGKVSLGENGIKYVTQALTDAQKKQARTNIGAGTSNFSGSYNDLSNKPNIPAATVIDTTLTKSGQAADAKAAGDAIDKKLDKAQGTGNAGKILGIGADGNVTPQDKPVQALEGDAAPTTATAGVVGQEYYVIADGEVTEMYVCTAVANGTYTWGKAEFGAEIDDTSTEPTKVWSAEKCNQLSKEISNLEGFVLGTANLKSWKEVQELIRAGFAPKILKVGDQLECQRDGVKLTWDIIGLDCDTPVNPGLTHSMTLQLHDGWKLLQFDAVEALYYCETELAAGTYNFTLLAGYDTTYGGGKTYSFTLANAVPAGGVIMFPWEYHKQAAETKISTYASRGSTTVIESVSVTEGANGTSLGTADGKSANMNHTHRIRYGSNKYSTSAMRQLLNSDAAAGKVWTPQTIYDRPPAWAATQNGFLAGLDPDFLAVVADVKKRTALNTITDGGGYEDTVEKFFLLSCSEVYAGLENSVNEGNPYPYYSDFSDLSAAGSGEDGNRIKYMDGVANY